MVVVSKTVIAHCELCFDLDLIRKEPWIECYSLCIQVKGWTQDRHAATRRGELEFRAITNVILTDVTTVTVNGISILFLCLAFYVLLFKIKPYVFESHFDSSLCSSSQTNQSFTHYNINSPPFSHLLECYNCFTLEQWILFQFLVSQLS